MKIIKMCIKHYHTLIKMDDCKACKNSGIRSLHKHMRNNDENRKKVFEMLKIYNNSTIEMLPSGNFFYFHYQETCRICNGNGYGGKSYWRKRDEYFR